MKALHSRRPRCIRVITREVLVRKLRVKGLTVFLLPSVLVGFSLVNLSAAFFFKARFSVHVQLKINCTGFIYCTNCLRFLLNLTSRYLNNNFFDLFIHFGLCWVFTVAPHLWLRWAGPALQLQSPGFSLWWLLCCMGFKVLRLQYLPLLGSRAWTQKLWHRGLVAP